VAEVRTVTWEQLAAALLDVYDTLPGPSFLNLSDMTRETLVELARQRATLGRGRVTDRRFDIRLKENRHDPG
jgi:hypothetical protein